MSDVLAERERRAKNGWHLMGEWPEDRPWWRNGMWLPSRWTEVVTGTHETHWLPYLVVFWYWRGRTLRLKGRRLGSLLVDDEIMNGGGEDYVPSKPKAIRTILGEELREVVPSLRWWRKKRKWPKGAMLIEPPDIAGYPAAAGAWTEAPDAEPLPEVKPVHSVSRWPSTRIGFKNFGRSDD
jgi:hypothetical protein